MSKEIKTFKVYKHTNIINGKVYVGITCVNPKKRWANGRGYTSNIFFDRAIKKYGWNNFLSEILFKNLTKDEACKKEIELIEFYKSNNQEFGYNLSKGGEHGHLGCKHSEETRAKMRNNHADLSGKNNVSSIPIICLDTLEIYDSTGEAGRKLGIGHGGINRVLKKRMKSFHGMHFEYLSDYDPNKEYDLSVGITAEVRLKISNSKKGQPSWIKGKKHSEESILKMRNAKLGKVQSLETRRKMSIIMLNNSNSKKVICIETGEVFPSIAEAGRRLKLSSGNINAVCLGNRNSTGKLHFKYYTGDKNE